jgi:anti-anti-sigma factor
MKSKSIFNSEDFPVENIKGISIITINVPRATSSESEEFKQILHALMLANQNKIIVDFSDCTFADSMMIGLLVETAKAIREKNGDILIVTPTNSIKIMFARMGLYKIFKQFWTKAEAIESFSIL